MDQSTKAPKGRKRDPDTKLARHRLSVLELARELGNVAEACRQRELDRTSFYEWKRRFQVRGTGAAVRPRKSENGLQGAEGPAADSQEPPTIDAPETVARIKTLTIAHPAYGCNRFEAMLALERIGVLSITIQKILNENGLGTKSDRWLALELEQANADKRIELTPEQAAFIEKLNPCFRERHVESSAPGELLSADTFFVGSLKGIGRVSPHTPSSIPSAAMKAVAAERRRFGYRRIHIMLERQGIVMNLKKLRRLYREEHLQVRKRGGRKRALGTRRPMAVPRAANDRWSLDFISDALTDGRRFRVLAVVDDFTRECLALVADTSLSGTRVVRELDAVIARRGRPGTIVSDNGTEFTSTAILSWCQRTDIAWHYIAPGKPMRDTASSRASTAGFAMNS